MNIKTSQELRFEIGEKCWLLRETTDGPEVLESEISAEYIGSNGRVYYDILNDFMKMTSSIYQIVKINDVTSVVEFYKKYEKRARDQRELFEKDAPTMIRKIYKQEPV